jgi:hypothetical protein
VNPDDFTPVNAVHQLSDLIGEFGISRDPAGVTGFHAAGWMAPTSNC